MSKDIDPDEFLKSFFGITCTIGALATVPVAVYWWVNYKSLTKPVYSQRRIFICFSSGILLMALWVLFLDRFPLYRPELLYSSVNHGINVYLILFKIVWLWGVGLSFSYLVAPVILQFKKDDIGIRVKNFGVRIYRWQKFRKAFNDPNVLPVGIDVKTQKVISITQTERAAHSLCVGAPGMGKTTLMLLWIMHAIKHNQPLVLIDPKGDNSTLDEVVRFGRLVCADFDKRFQLFTIYNPSISSKYNPLKHGNANQLKDRIMEAFTWSEQYYQSVAGSFLTELTAATEYLGIPLTLDRISKILTFKEEQSSILSALKDKFQSGPGNDVALERFNALTQYFSKNKEDALSGLNAQLTILNNPTFGKLLSFDKAENEIDLRESRKAGKIAYFQLDTLANADSARRLGRMVIEDLKSLSSEVYKTEPDESKRQFYPIFIDEFGSFATREFIEFLKQSRGAKFGIHLFCQGLEDLDVVSPEFKRQVISSTMNKVGMRIDDNETVNELCATAGTFDALEQSHQVEGKLIAMKTGMGNLRETKQMQIEHDVLRQLCRGEAVVILKSPNRVSGIKFCRPNDLI